MHDQLSEYLDSSFNPFLAAFRKGFWVPVHSAENAARLAKAFDNHECIAAILMESVKGV